MGTILASLYLVMLEQELETICTSKNIKCPTFYKRFIDECFSILIGTKTEFITWQNEFNTLRKEITIDKWTFGNDVNFMDLYIYKAKIFSKKENLTFQLTKHVVRNYVTRELKRRVRINTKLFFWSISSAEYW